MRCPLRTRDTVWLAGETWKRFRVFGGLTRGRDGRGWPLLAHNAWAGPSHIQHDKQPQKSQDDQRIEKQVWNHGQAPSLSGETGRVYLILGPMELSAA